MILAKSSSRGNVAVSDSHEPRLLVAVGGSGEGNKVTTSCEGARGFGVACMARIGEAQVEEDCLD